MTDQDRILGRLEEHRDQANARFSKIDEKLDALLAFKWRLIGVSVAASSAISVLVEILIIRKWPG